MTFNLAKLINEHFGFTIHPRSIERVLEKIRKKNKGEMMETNRCHNHDKEILIKRYEELRSQVLKNGILHYDGGVK